MPIRISHQTISSLFYLLLISFLLADSVMCALDPIELVSIKLDSQILGKGSDPRTIEYSHRFSTNWDKI